MAFESGVQALAALVEAVRENTTELRLVKIAQLETRDIQRDVLAALTAAAPPATNGRAQQIPLNGTANDSDHDGPKGPRPHATPDPWGNFPERGLSLELREGKAPAWNVSYTPKEPVGAEPLRLGVRLDEYGEDSFRHAKTVLAIYRGQDRANNLERLPGPLRLRVLRKLYPSG